MPAMTRTRHRATAPLGPADPRPAVAVRAGSRSSSRSPSSLAAIVLDFGLHADPTVLFVVSAAAILGLAWVVGLSTERLGSLTGPQVGGILNATFGNIAELIIAFFALQAGLIEVVKASLTGSIIGNLLLVLGASVLIGGLRHGTQTFSAEDRRARTPRCSSSPSSGCSCRPSSRSRRSDPAQGTLTEESVLVAIVLIIGYVLSLVYQFTNPARDARRPRRAGGPRRAGLDRTGRDRRPARRGRRCWRSCRRSSSARSSRSSSTFGLSAVLRRRRPHPDHRQPGRAPGRGPAGGQGQDGVRDGRDLRVQPPGRAVRGAGPGPLGVVIGQPMDLVFTPLEVAAVAAAVGISALIALDGESNWLEGALLMLVYVILAVSFFEFV